MRRRLYTLLLALMAMLWPLPALAGLLAAPQIRPGQHVYLLPAEGFEPPGLSAAGIADLERELSRERYPFYVVIARSLPGSGTPEELSTRAIDALVADLGDQSAFDVATSSVFLWAPSLRQYRFMAGARWKAELGFAREATAPYSARFVPFMPRDPHGAILAVAQAVDAYLVDRTDPARLAARAEVARQEAARLARTKRALGLAALAALALWGLERRRRRLARLRRAFEETCVAWEEKVGNAYLRYVDFDADRDAVARLGVNSGETAVLFQEVSGAVDRICHAVRAMQAHLVKCRDEAAKGSFLQPAPLAAAREAIEAPFAFDTGLIDESELFGRETRIITVDPRAFARDLEKQFRAAMARWQTLKDAAKLQLVEPEQAFPRAGHDALIADLARHGLGARWMSPRHPIVKNAALYADLEALRGVDPVSYAARIADHLETEASLRRTADRLIAAVTLARSQGPVELPAETTVGEDDDPSKTLDEARREDARLAGILAGSDRVKQVEEQARLVHELFARAAEQAATIEHARAGAAKAIEDVQRDAARAREAQAQAAARIAAARAVHASIAPATAACARGDAQIEAGVAAQSVAGHRLTDLRHLDAQRGADKATRAFRSALEALQEACAECSKLDETKAAFEARLARAPGLFAKAVATIESCGATPGFGAYARPRYQAGTPTDYAELDRQLEQQHTRWQREADRVERAHEAKLEAIRREDAQRAHEAVTQLALAQALQQEHAQAATDASSSSSTFDSSGGGYSGGGDSSGGGYSGGSDSSGGGY